MPFSNTTSQDPGFTADDGPYPDSKIVRMDINLETKRMNIMVKHGTVVDGVFQSGAATRTNPRNYVVKNLPAEYDAEGVEVTPADPQFDNLIAVNSGQTYADVKAAAYQWLVDNAGYAGSVV